MRLRKLLGTAFLAAGGLFAFIDSVILAKGWAAYGLDWWDKLSYGAAAASIPWVVVGYPFVWWVLWGKARWRAVFPLTIAGIVYALLIAYSLVGAMGSIATQRGQVIAERKGAWESIEALKEQRKRLEDQLAGISKHRPVGQLTALLAAEKVKPAWDWTEGCKEPRTGSQRRFCTDMAVLQGELSAAAKSDELVAKLDTLNGQIDGRIPVGEKADPMASTLASWTGISEAVVTARLPIATPLILLIGEMVFVWFGFLMREIDHKQLVMGGHEVPRDFARPVERGEAVSVRVNSSPAPALPPPSRDPVAAGRQLAQWFFSECTRPVASGGLPEDDWYALYKEQCARSNDTPIEIEAFRTLAASKGAKPVLIEGRWFYRQVLPLVPREGAA
jgi:hypothetical protein